MKTANTQHMNSHPAYIAARAQATKLADEHSKLEQEINSLNATRNKAQTGNAWLAAGVAALEGGSPTSPKLSELTRRRDAIAGAIVPAHREIHNAARLASREYFTTQAPATLSAMDGLLSALDGVLVACDAFKTLRDTGDSLGYDHDSSGLPLAIDEKFSEFVKEALPELKRDADRLRDSIDSSLDDAVMTIHALANLNIYGISLKLGETGNVPARYGRELIRCGNAEETTPGRARMSKLKQLIG